jgi:hypothetical protein
MNMKDSDMATKIRVVLTKPARLLFSSITEKSAPKGVLNAVSKFSGTFGVEKEDFDILVKHMVAAITSELGQFGKPDDYYLACMSGETAAKRALAKADFDAQGKPADEVFKIKERAEARATMYRQHAGILTASSQFDVSLAKVEGGKIVDIDQPHAIAQAGKDCFYPGAFVVPSIELSPYRAKTVDAKPGVTAYLQNVLFIRKGERIGGQRSEERRVGKECRSRWSPYH